MLNQTVPICGGMHCMEMIAILTAFYPTANHNRMIRRWFPKGTDFTKVTKKRVAEVQNWMNDYPRKILDWYSPNELAA